MLSFSLLQKIWPLLYQRPYFLKYSFIHCPLDRETLNSHDNDRIDNYYQYIMLQASAIYVAVMW